MALTSPPARKFYTGFPVLAIWDSTLTPPGLLAVIRWHEEDNQPEPADWWPVKELDVPTITTAGGKRVEYIRGYRVTGEVRYQVWPEDGCTQPRVTVGLQVTEYEMNFIRDAETRGWHLQYFPHGENYDGVYDVNRDIVVLTNEAHRKSAQDRAFGTFRFEYVSLVKTSANIWTYLDHL